MFGKWFQKNEEQSSQTENQVPGFGLLLREPRKNRSRPAQVNPPAGADRDFVYDEG